MATVRRTYTYLLALAGLLVTIYAAAGMLALIISTLVLPAGSLLSAGDLRTRASLYLAELVVGVPVWLGHWLAGERSAARKLGEPDPPQRRLFLATVFAVTSVVALFALHDLLRVVLTAPGAGTGQPTIATGIRAAARLLVYGVAWVVHTRLQRRRSASRATALAVDDAHDLAVFVLSGIALAFLLTGLEQAIRQVIGDVLPAGGAALLAAPQPSLWSIWGAIAAWVLSGGSIWALVWRYDLARHGRRMVRVVYLYVVLFVAVPVTLGSGINTLYELLRRLFRYQPTDPYWSFLGRVLAPFLVAGATWAYHWLMLRRQARYAISAPVVPTSDERPGRNGRSDLGIAWPRRLALALLALLGLAASAPAFVSLLWLGLDGLLHSGAALSGPDWWRDRLSLSIAAGAVGAVAWLAPWWRLQRAAAMSKTERAAQERRLLLGFIAVAGVLFAFGFLIALLWLAFRALLGAPLGPHEFSTALKESSGALVALLLAIYHGLILRTDVNLAPAPVAPRRVRVLVAPGAEALLTALQQEQGVAVDVAGRLLEDAQGEQLDLAALVRQLAAAGPDEEGIQTLLVLGSDGAALFRYRN